MLAVSLYSLLFLLLLLGLGLGLAERWARQRERPQVPWILATLGAGILGYLVGALLVSSAVLSASTILETWTVLAAAISAPLLATLFQTAVLWLLHRTPPDLPRLTGDSWPVYVVATGDREGGESRLTLEGGTLRVESLQLEIGLEQLDEIELDGECLRLLWSGDSLLLRPSVPGNDEGAAARMSRALQRRIRAARR